MGWMLLAAASAIAGPIDLEALGLELGPKVFGSQPEAVQDRADQGQVRISLAGREGDTLKIDGWPFGTLPVETELAAGLHTFQVDGEAGRLQFDAVVIVQAEGVVEIDLAAAIPPPEQVTPTSVQGNKPRLDLAREPSPAQDDPTAEPTASIENGD